MERPRGKGFPGYGTPPLCFRLLPSDLGAAAVIWRPGEAERIVRIYLPRARRELSQAIAREFPEALLAASGPQGAMMKTLGLLLRGEAAGLAADALETGTLAPFRRRILLEAGRIPRGKVRTYGSLAAAAGFPGAARAAGRAMATNPFPLAIPCHRVVLSDGSLGGFGGGPALKRTLLEREGVTFDARGRVRLDRIL